MAPKQAACEPCRLSKLACDHVHPICGRCRRLGKSTSCLYRTSPFRKQTSRPRQNTQSALHDLNVSPENNVDSRRSQRTIEQRNLRHSMIDTPQQIHPNPGYLGPSSHTTFFEYLPKTLQLRNEPFISCTIADEHQYPSRARDEQIKRGQTLLEDAFTKLSISLCAKLVDAWIASSVNLALARPFTSLCVRSVESLAKDTRYGTTSTFDCSANLFLQSSAPILAHKSSKLEDFRSQFTFERSRWETIGIFLTAVSRATIDLPQFHGLYINQAQRSALRTTSMRYADTCLELCLELDCLNDIQLILQYENFINHSWTDGDQSYHSWKRLGDMISSLYALGYHANTRANEDTPEYLRHLREAAFAFTYSADKNVSIFLGRPPRMFREFCAIEFLNIDNNATHDSTNEYIGWSPSEPFDYMIEAWWSMICAMQKEQVLALSRETNQDSKLQNISHIKACIEKYWQVLPDTLRLKTSVIWASDLPIERDFIASARLNYLHVLFLAYSTVSRQIQKPSSPLLDVSAEILNIVVQVAMLKGQLLNSGTGTIWKVAYYGLPAAAVLCLALLNQCSLADDVEMSRVTIFQNLSVLVAEINTGALIDPVDANFTLLSKAAGTIEAILAKMLISNPPSMPATNTFNLRTADEPRPTFQSGEWGRWTTTDNWDFEIDFWTNLADHPTLQPI